MKKNLTRQVWTLAAVLLFVVCLFSSTAAAANEELQTPDDLNGRQVGILTGSVFEDILKECAPNAEAVYFSAMTDETVALQSGKIDAFLADEPIARYITGQDPNLTVLPDLVRVDSYAYAFPKENTALRDEVNTVLAQLREDGTLDEIDARWFGSDENAKVLPDLELTGERGTIRFATNSTLTPFSYLKDGEIVGYDIEIAMYICERLGYAMELTDLDFNGILPGLMAGRFDMAGACIAVTEERADSVSFSDPNYTGGIAVVVSAPEAASSGSFLTTLKDGFYKTFIVENRWRLFAQGLGITVLISVLSLFFGTILGFGICMASRSKHRPAFLLARFFIKIMQGVPVLVLLMILFYLVLVQVKNGVIVAVIGFSLNFAAYVSEMMRMGIDTVDKGQLEAATAMSFSRLQTFCKITAPQAVRYVIPIYRGEAISLLKMTSIVGYIAVQDLTRMSDIVRGMTFNAFFSLISTAVIYFILANLLALGFGVLERKFDPKRRKRKVKGVKMA